MNTYLHFFFVSIQAGVQSMSRKWHMPADKQSARTILMEKIQYSPRCVYDGWGEKRVGSCGVKGATTLCSRLVLDGSQYQSLHDHGNSHGRKSCNVRRGGFGRVLLVHGVGTAIQKKRGNRHGALFAKRSIGYALATTANSNKFAKTAECSITLSAPSAEPKYGRLMSV